MARILLPALNRFKLDTVAKAVGVSLDNHHRAVDDAGMYGRNFSEIRKNAGGAEIFLIWMS